ncbi:hypothetical protein C8J56DRAFT_899178 [Mycena floridula]|nr:hypothetical protein C8J56DRAFT_899178 [Mycena floridula]
MDKKPAYLVLFALMLHPRTVICGRASWPEYGRFEALIPGQLCQQVRAFPGNSGSHKLQHAAWNAPMAGRPKIGTFGGKLMHILAAISQKLNLEVGPHSNESEKSCPSDRKQFINLDKRRPAVTDSFYGIILCGISERSITRSPSACEIWSTKLGLSQALSLTFQESKWK